MRQDLNLATCPSKIDVALRYIQTVKSLSFLPESPEGKLWVKSIQILTEYLDDNEKSNNDK